MDNRLSATCGTTANAGPGSTQRETSLSEIFNSHEQTASYRFLFLDQRALKDRLRIKACVIGPRGISGYHSFPQLPACGRGLNATTSSGLAIEADAFARMLPTKALHDGLQQFLKKRSSRDEKE